jgi:hypothetical protein
MCFISLYNFFFSYNSTPAHRCLICWYGWRVHVVCERKFPRKNCFHLIMQFQLTFAKMNSLFCLSFILHCFRFFPHIPWNVYVDIILFLFAIEVKIKSAQLAIKLATFFFIVLKKFKLQNGDFPHDFKQLCVSIHTFIF